MIGAVQTPKNFAVLEHGIETGPSKDIAITLQNAFDGQHILGLIAKLRSSVEIRDFVDRLSTRDRQRLLIWTFQLFPYLDFHRILLPLGCEASFSPRGD